MATKIKVKRRLTTGNENVILDKGEPFYNVADKHFYIGNEDGSTPKTHIAEITSPEESKGDDWVEFRIGEDPQNVYSKKINNVEKAQGLSAKNSDNSDVIQNNSEGNTISFKIGDAEFNYTFTQLATTKLESPRSIDGINFDGSAPVSRYCVCTNEPGWSEKEVTVSNLSIVNEAPEIGTRISVKFVNGNTVYGSDLKLNINGTGAKDIRCNGSPLSSGTITKDDIYDFIFIKDTNKDTSEDIYYWVLLSGGGGSGGASMSWQSY